MTAIPSWLREKTTARFPQLDDTWDCERLQVETLTLYDRAANLLATLGAHYDGGDIPATPKWPEYIRTAVMELGCLRSDGRETAFKLMSLRSECEVISIGCKDAMASGRGIGGMQGAMQGMMSEVMKIVASPEFSSLKEMLGPAFGAGARAAMPGMPMYGSMPGIPMPGIPMYGSMSGMPVPGIPPELMRDFQMMPHGTVFMPQQGFVPPQGLVFPEPPSREQLMEMLAGDVVPADIKARLQSMLDEIDGKADEEPPVS